MDKMDKMDMLKLLSYGKINLFLDVEGKKQDGYHIIKSVMQSVSIYDEIFLQPVNGNNIIISCSDISIPINEENICYKAAHLIKEKYSINSGVRIHINKTIPKEAGLAGGSANAAAVLKGLNVLWNLNFSDEEMKIMGAQIGADVPFCLTGGTCLAEGIGDKVTELNNFSWDDILIIKPEFSMSTAFVYKNLTSDHYNLYKDNKILKYILSYDYENTALSVANTLEKVVEKLHPEIDAIKKLMIDSGALSCIMTGSGSAVFALFKDSNSLNEAYNISKKIYRNIYKAKTISTGVKFLNK